MYVRENTNSESKKFMKHFLQHVLSYFIFETITMRHCMLYDTSD